MKHAGRIVAFAAAVAALAFSGYAAGGDLSASFVEEEIKPYVKIMQGPWLDNDLSGTRGNYRIAAKIPRDAQYVVGLFDRKVGRTGAEERSAVVLVDGVNPLAPGEKVPVTGIDRADVSGFRKVPLDGITFNSQDSAGADCYLKVVDAKEDGMPGPVEPFSIPAGAPARGLVRIDVFIFAGPAYPPVPGQVVQYGKPLTRFAFTLAE